MLESLRVKNLALIEEAEVEFKDGLNVLTGETGAGKSILIGSVNLALGAKADKDLIRTGKEFAFVELVFYTKDENVIKKAEEMDIYPEDDRFIISRKISQTKSVSKINGENMTIEVVDAIELLPVGENLADRLRHVFRFQDGVDFRQAVEVGRIGHIFEDNPCLFHAILPTQDSHPRSVHLVKVDSLPHHR